MLVEPGQRLGGLERFLDPPALPGHPHEGAQWHRTWGVAAQVGQFAGAVVAADQQVMMTGVGVVLGPQRGPGPGVKAVPVAARAGRVFLPRPRGQPRREPVAPDRAGLGGQIAPSRHAPHRLVAVRVDRGQPRNERGA
jgi:hypothetical protein